LVSGYQGRANKEPDSCYSFWIGATLQLLQHLSADLDVTSSAEFLCCQCQHVKLGGFGKFPGEYPDLVHSFYSLSYLSMITSSTSPWILSVRLEVPVAIPGSKEKSLESNSSNDVSSTSLFQLNEIDPRYGICQDKVKFYFR
jgi:prenyltransferase beta subunit